MVLRNNLKFLSRCGFGYCYGSLPVDNDFGPIVYLSTWQIDTPYPAPWSDTLITPYWFVFKSNYRDTGKRLHINVHILKKPSLFEIWRVFIYIHVNVISLFCIGLHISIQRKVNIYAQFLHNNNYCQICMYIAHMTYN